jgi:chaperone BCS1
LFTILLYKELKVPLIGDALESLKPTIRIWYYSQGIHNQRGYEFHRPTEIGKFSFAFPLAGHFNLDVYVLNIPTINKHTIKKLYAELP